MTVPGRAVRRRVHGRVRAVVAVTGAVAVVLLLVAAGPAAAGGTGRDRARAVVPAAATVPTSVTDTHDGAPGPAPGLRQVQDCAPVPRQATRSGSSGDGDPLAAAHRLVDGSGQRVAVIDTGVARHPRLDGRLVGGGDYLAGGDGLSDCDGHGTEVAGLLAASPDPATRSGGGVAPGAQVLSLRQSSSRFAVTGPDGRERPAGEIDTLAAAIDRAVALGAGVVNISEVVCVPADQVERAGRPVHDAVRRASAAGVLVVAAAGNVDPTGSCTGDPGLQPLPARFDEVLAVGAVDGRDRPATFTVPGDWVDVAAPGVDVRPSATGAADAQVLNGTSYAAPVVSGVAALLRERFPGLTPGQVADRLRATARHPAQGRDPDVGYGVVDPVAALTAEPLLLSPSTDPAGGAVTGPRTGAGSSDDGDPATAPLPAAQHDRPEQVPATAAGIAAVLVVGAATVPLLRRLRRLADAPGRTPLSSGPTRRPARPPGPGRRSGPAPRPGAAGAARPPAPARRR